MQNAPEHLKGPRQYLAAIAGSLRNELMGDLQSVNLKDPSKENAVKFLKAAKAHWLPYHDEKIVRMMMTAAVFVGDPELITHTVSASLYDTNTMERALLDGGWSLEAQIRSEQWILENATVSGAR